MNRWVSDNSVYRLLEKQRHRCFVHAPSQHVAYLFPFTGNIDIQFHSKWCWFPGNRIIRVRKNQSTA